MNGTPQITNLEQAKAYNDAYNSLKSSFEKSHLDNIDLGVLWCQTGGWENLIGDGSAECCRTALATLASINSNSVVTPNDTVAEARSVTINGKQYDNKELYTYTYETGAQSGYTTYFLNSENALLKAINTELAAGRAVEVKTKADKLTSHWVTVTDTVDGNKAKSFSDLIGVDPWYNSTNDKYYDQKDIEKYYSSSSTHSGIVQLSETQKGQGFNNLPNPYKDNKIYYVIKTVNVD